MASTAASDVRSASSLATRAAASGFLPVTVSVITRLVVSEETLTVKSSRFCMPSAFAVESTTVEVLAILARSFASCWEACVSELVTCVWPLALLLLCVSTYSETLAV